MIYLNDGFNFVMWLWDYYIWIIRWLMVFILLRIIIKKCVNVIIDIDNNSIKNFNYVYIIMIRVMCYMEYIICRFLNGDNYWLYDKVFGKFIMK